MHYYQRNLGDYGRDTGHLSALEHGVYTLLLDWYYVNERPITLKEAIRVSRGNPDETQVVLSEFFKETEQGWIHSYADRVIAEYHVKAERNRKNGSKGGRPKASQVVDPIEDKTQSVISGMPKLTLTNNQEPITKNQEEAKAEEAKASLSAEAPPTCPHQKIIALYHEHMPLNPRIKSWEGTRMTNLQARWRSDPKRQQLVYWERFFKHCANSAFLTGQADGRGDRPFLPSLEWMVKQSNFNKIIEGNYHPRGPQ